MRKFLFLPKDVTFAALAVVTLATVKFAWPFKILTYLTVGSAFFNFRKHFIPYRDTLKNDGEIFLSPIHGTIQSIRRTAEDLFEIRIFISLFNEKGLYLPTAGEISYLKATKGRKISRNADAKVFYGHLDEIAHTDIVLTSKNQLKTSLRFIDCIYGRRPSIWLKSGDRGRGAACFGYYPFGGTLLIYLPGNSDVLVFENEKVVPGQTVIAALKNPQ